MKTNLGSQTFNLGIERVNISVRLDERYKSLVIKLNIRIIIGMTKKNCQRYKIY